MKGMIFTNFRYLVEEQFGERVMDDILAACPLASEGAYTALGNYPHQELVCLLEELSRRVGVSTEELTVLYGAYLITAFRQQYPGYFSQAADTFAFLRQVQDVIHREVAQLFERADPPGFRWSQPSPDHLVLIYTSRRRMGTLARGMILACCEHFGEEIRVEQAALPDPNSVRFDLWKVAA